MAKIELRFLDVDLENTFIMCESGKNDSRIEHLHVIQIDSFENDDLKCSIYLDKSTAIKFAKTLRTEINKIKD